MKILLDTSVLVAALVQKHPDHSVAFSWLQKAKDKAFTDIVSLMQEDYLATIEHLASARIIGGATYDALLLCAAEKENVDRVVTFNIDDFSRIAPALAKKIISPHLEI